MKQLSLVISALLFFSTISFAQTDPIIRYYDSNWLPVKNEYAHYILRCDEEGELYNCKAYWVASKQISFKAYYADTSFSNPVGKMIKYFESGKLKDSSFYDDESRLLYAFRYYESGNLRGKFSLDTITNIAQHEGYDEQGKKIKGFIFLRNAEFKGGMKKWPSYLSENLKPQVPIKRGAPSGNYKVMVRFIVDEKGNVTNIEPETNFGYGMEEEAMRVIKRSPKWQPMIFLGEYSKAYRRQPITFSIID